MSQTADICEMHVIHQEEVDRAATLMPAERTFEDLAAVFKVLSHPTRLKIVHALSGDELCVCDLAALLGTSASAVSHQLRLLRTMRLVRHRREGKLIYYALDDDHVRQLFTAAMDHLEE